MDLQISQRVSKSHQLFVMVQDKNQLTLGRFPYKILLLHHVVLG